MLLQALCIISQPLVNSNWSYSPETPNLGQIRWFLEPCDLEIWRMTLQNNREPLQCYFKLCASFPSHWWIQTEVTVQKRPIWVEYDDFHSCVTLKFDGWPWKTIGHLFYAASSFVHHFVAIGEFKLELQSRNAQSGSNLTISYLCDLDLWPLTLIFCMDITLVIGNNSWKFHHDTMMGTLSKGVTDRQTDGNSHS